LPQQFRHRSRESQGYSIGFLEEQFRGQK
jgi:hypothetical protein